MAVAAKSLILDLLSTVRRGAVPVRALVEAAELFGIADNSLRVALARLVADGLVERDERGRYRIGPRAAVVNAELAGWRRLEQRVREWRGGWIAVHTAGLPRVSAAARRRRGRALRFLGFRELAAGLELRPDNLVGGAQAARERLYGLGLDGEALVFAVPELDAAAERRAAGLWDGAALVARYRACRQALEASAARLHSLPRAAAMTESFLLGGEAIRVLVFDPLLPDPIVDVGERHALGEAMRRYDRLGRRAWAGWLGEQEAPPTRAPADLSGRS